MRNPSCSAHFLALFAPLLAVGLVGCGKGTAADSGGMGGNAAGIGGSTTAAGGSGSGAGGSTGTGGNTIGTGGSTVSGGGVTGTGGRARGTGGRTVSTGDGTGAMTAGTGGVTAGTGGRITGTGGKTIGTGGTTTRGSTTSTGGDTADAGVTGTGGTTRYDAGAANDAPADAPTNFSIGCSAPTLTAGVTNGSIVVGGTTRTYTLFVPSGSATTPRSLVVGFHGLGDSGAGYRDLLGLETPAKGAAIFAYPDGLVAPEGSFGWPNTGGQDVAFFDALLDKLASQGCVDLNRVFVTGFSYGGDMSTQLGCERAGVVRGTAVMAGDGPKGGTCTGKPVAAWLSMGDTDGTGVLTADTRDFFRSANRCGTTSHATTPSPCVTYDGCASGYPVTWCLFNGGHEIPSFAATAIWSFFSGL
jgi:polyhydroxybutyrate depolymerase